MHGPALSRPVVVAVDQGPGHEDLVRFAAREAALRGRPLHIVHVLELPLPGGSPTDEEEARAAHEAGNSLVEHHARAARDEVPDLAVTAEHLTGEPSDVLIACSARAEVILTGHRGQGGLPRLPLGGTSWHVATHAGCPVLVVRHPEATEPRDNCVVVGVDTDDDTCHQVLDLAYREADLRGARLEVVHSTRTAAATPTGVVTTVPLDAPLAHSGPRATLLAELESRRTRFPHVNAQVRVEHASPAPLLVEVSRSACLLVVGSRRRTGLRRFLLGSVSAKILHTADCPVAVLPVRPGE